MRYSLILPWITIVTALPQLQQESYFSERDARAAPVSFHQENVSGFGRRDAKGGRNTAVLKNTGSTARRAGGRLAMEFGPDIIRMMGNDANQLLMQKLLNQQSQPAPAPQFPAPAPAPQASAPQPQAQAPSPEGQAPPAQDQAPQPQNQTLQPQRRDPSWESALAKEASHLFHEYGSDVGKSVVKTTANNINQSQQQKQQQQPTRRDPNFFKSLGNDFKKVVHGAEQVAKTVGPTALKYAPEVAGVLMARNLELAARDRDALEARDPNFFKSLGNDFKKAAHGAEHLAGTVGPIALQYAPEIAGAVLMARDLEAVARDLDALEARDPNFFKSLGNDIKKGAKAIGKGAEQFAKTFGPTALKYAPEVAMGLMARDLEALEARDPNFFKTLGNDIRKGAKGAENLALTYGPDIALALIDHQSSGKRARDLGWEGSLVRRYAEPESSFEEVYERDADPEVYFEDLYERDAEPESYFDGLFEREIWVILRNLLTRVEVDGLTVCGKDADS
ncbi:hypothetical protein MMC30_005913 [Trapelia coarctata]|nr:hypothetical protein [Trapelia coarctata]